MGEIWKMIPGYGNRFRVSNLGRVQKKKRYFVNRKGKRVKVYQWVFLKPFWRYQNGGKWKSKMVRLDNKTPAYTRVSVAYLVAKAFLSTEKRKIIHRNGDKWDCRLANLTFAKGDAVEFRKEKIREFFYSDEINKRGARLALANELGITAANLTHHIKELEKENMEALISTDFKWSKFQGKVRDVYDLNNGLLALVSTDRISAFDRVVGSVKGRGQILNLLSSFWFQQTGSIVPTHFVAAPHPNVSIVKKTEVTVPIEFIPRGYATGSYYEKLEGTDQEVRLNAKLDRPVMTYTTKAEEGHDEWIYLHDIINTGIMTTEQVNEANEICTQLYTYGVYTAEHAGLVLADTKIELGIINENLTVIDEILTPDASRFWDMKTNKSFDKDILRNWLREHPEDEGNLPQELQDQILREYSKVYEALTLKSFDMIEAKQEEIEKAISEYAN